MYVCVRMDVSVMRLLCVQKSLLSEAKQEMKASGRVVSPSMKSIMVVTNLGPDMFRVGLKSSAACGEMVTEQSSLAPLSFSETVTTLRKQSVKNS